MQCLSRPRGRSDGASERCRIFLGKSRRDPDEGQEEGEGAGNDGVASRLIKYATIISVSTEARSPFPSLRDAAKRSLFGSTTRGELRKR